MLEEVKLTPIEIDRFSEFVGDDLIFQIKELAARLKNKKIIHINATEKGGGVAEILKSLVPLMAGIGLDAKWFVLRPDSQFFKITNQIHDALQGADNIHLSSINEDFYKKESQKFANDLKKINADIWFVHDPQPLAIFSFIEKKEPKILRIHLDLSSPDNKVWQFILPLVRNYQKIIFSANEFVNEEISQEKIEIFQPAIDPLKTKNIPMPLESAHIVFADHGINPTHPIITQVSRFDRWKDPLGVINAYYIAKKEIPDLQLVLYGLSSTKDNPNSKKIYKEVERYSQGDHDIFSFYNPEDILAEDETMVNAFQSAANVVIQKSLKEGFGLTVTEAMWKERAVVAGRAGGIKLQIKDGYNGFLVNNPQECAEKIVRLIKDPSLAHQMGQRAKETVRSRFLIPRLLNDYLLLINKLIKI